MILFRLHLQTVWWGGLAVSGIQATGVVPRVLCSHMMELQGGARLRQFAAFFEPVDCQLVEAAACGAVQRGIVTSAQCSVSSGAVDPHCGV